MSDENNKRYIGEVFIDSKSDRLLQEFLTQLFNSYNGPGKGFNADMVDDWHLDDILKYVDEELDKKLDTITIGNTVFTVYDSSKFLQLTDVIYNEFQSLEDAEWAKYIRDDTSGEIYDRGSSTVFIGNNYLASDILLDIYKVLDVNKFDKSTWNKFYEDEFDPLRTDHINLREDYEAFKEPFANVLKDVTIIDENGNRKTVKMLDAELINGFRIIPITQAAYDNLDNEEKAYWRNIFIIVDEIPDDYVNPISFRLFKDVKLVYNPNTQYVDYYDGISDTPMPLISMAELIENINFTQQFSEFLANTTNYTINPIALRDSLKEVVIDSLDMYDFPFITKAEGTVLASNIISTYADDEIGITSTQNDLHFSTFDISHAFDKKFNELENSIDTVARNLYDAETRIMGEVDSNYTKSAEFAVFVRDNKADISALNQNLGARITSLENKVIKNSLKILIGRWSSKNEGPTKNGEYGTQIIVPNSGNGIYARVLCDDPNFKNKLNDLVVYIDYQNRIYTFKTEFNNDNNPTGNGNRGIYKEVDSNGVVSATTGRLGINRPENERGQEYLIHALARYGNEIYPAFVIKKMVIEGP